MSAIKMLTEILKRKKKKQKWTPPPHATVTLQGLFGSVQLLLLLGQLHAELGGREHVGRAASLGLLQVFTQHVLHLPQQAHLLLQLGHLLTQQDCNEKTGAEQTCSQPTIWVTHWMWT